MTARKQSNDLDFNGRLPIGLAAPVNPNDATRKAYVDTEITAAKSRANHTGTQLASTISDFDVAVRLNRLDQMAAPTGPLSLGTQKIINLGTPTAASDAATMGYVDTQLAGVTGGMTLKGSVRAVSAGAVTIASPGTTIDTLTPANGEVFLLAGNGSANGPYVYNGAAVPMTRAPNWDAAGEAVVGSYWVVREGTQADKFALMNNDTFTLGTTTATFTYVGVAGASATPPAEGFLGNGSATSFSVTHGFGTRSVLVSVYRATSPWDSVDVYWRMPDTNTVVIEPDVVFAANEFAYVISKA